MAINFVGNWTSAQFANSTGGSLAGRTSTAGNHVTMHASTNSGTHTITHSQAGTVQTGRTWEANGGDNVATMYVENIVGGASHTVTLATGAGSYSALHATERSGIATTGSLDKTAVGTGTDTTSPFVMTSGSTATTAQADEVLVGFAAISTNGDAAGASWSATGGFTVRGNTLAGDISSVSAAVDLIVAAAAAYTSNATLTDTGGIAGGSGAWIMQICTFKDAAAPAAPSYNLRRTGFGRSRMHARAR